MERGRPVIASRVGGLGELVEDGKTGLLVPPGEMEPLRAAIVRLGLDPTLAADLGAAGRRRAVESFSQQRCTERTESLYRAAIDGHLPSSTEP